MWSRLVNVVEEMWLTVCRTAFSLVIAEAQDFACELLDNDGETLAHSPRAMPVFNLTLPRAVKALLARYPAETLKPGDVLITNDPWLCAGHLFDIAIVTPGLPRWTARRPDGHGRPCLGHRRHQGFAARPRDLRGRPANPADEADRRRRRERDADRDDPTRTSATASRCWATSSRSSPPTSWAPSGCWPSWATTACTTSAHWPRWCRASAKARCAMRSGRSRMANTARSSPTTRSGEMLTYPVKVDGGRRQHQRRFRRRPAATAAGRAELDAELHRRACDLSAEMHADAAGARQCRLLPAVHGRPRRKARS